MSGLLRYGSFVLELVHRRQQRRERITDDHWELVRTEKEALGYDREAYEHSHRCHQVSERITDDHWELVRAEKEALGYDREAYEHDLSLLPVFKS